MRLTQLLCVTAILSTFPLSAEWVDVTGNLAGMASECGNLSHMSVVPGQDKVIAGVAKRGLWQTADGGATWTALGEDLDKIINRPSHIEYDPKDANIFWESGIYNSFGIYNTRDGGKFFTHLGSTKHIDYVSVDFSNPQRRNLLAGGHEQPRTVWKSTDGGATWTNIGMNLPAGTKFSTHPVFIDQNTYLVNCSGWGKGTGGVYRTTNGGATWTQASNLEANGAPLRASDGSLYWLLMFDRGIIRSTDQGQTWTQMCGGGLLKGSRVVELPDRRLVTTGNRSIRISSDHGTTWTAILSPTPVQPAGVIYASARQSFFIWQWDCGDKVLTNAIWRQEYRVATR